MSIISVFHKPKHTATRVSIDETSEKIPDGRSRQIHSIDRLYGTFHADCDKTSTGFLEISSNIDLNSQVKSLSCSSLRRHRRLVTPRMRIKASTFLSYSPLAHQTDRVYPGLRAVLAETMDWYQTFQTYAAPVDSTGHYTYIQDGAQTAQASDWFGIMLRPDPPLLPFQPFLWLDSEHPYRLTDPCGTFSKFLPLIARHHPQDLLRAVQHYFEAPDLLSEQQKAKANFITAIQALKISDASDTPHRAFQLEYLMRQLDMFFFGGHLRLADLHFGEHVFDAQIMAHANSWGFGGIHGCTFASTNHCAPPRILIKIEALEPWPNQPPYRTYKPRTLLCILSTLVHEMVHAFFIAFTCCCQRCFMVFHGPGGLLGPRGHGLVFQQLLDSIVKTMRHWDEELDGLRFFNRELDLE